MSLLTFSDRFLLPRLGSACCLLLATLLQAQEPAPFIRHIRVHDREVQVQVYVPAGLRKVTLETKERLEHSTWIPRLVEHIDGEACHLVFHLEMSRQHEMIRVRGDDAEPLPASFYEGATEFGGEVLASGDPGAVRYPTGFGDATAGPEASPDPASREVAESDLWRLRGDRLYFFNQLRGLQVIDISRPDQASVVAQLNVPAAGEQMYVPDDRHVLLLVRAGCYYGYEPPDSAVWVVDAQSSAPAVLARLPVPGQIVESRLVGTALYVASQSYRQIETGSGVAWEWGLVVSSFDLSQPDNPIPRDTLWHDGYGHVVSATDRFLFVVAQDPADWRRSLVHVIDISDPGGAMASASTLHLDGRVTDKFKIHLHNDTLTVIAQVQTTQLYTRLETFSMEDPTQPRVLGSLELGLSERLHATRFVEDRVYVVTFFVPFQMDPLWVVDLSSPETPRVLGELEIPGFSTFLHPLGDQIVALGIETNRTTVSLFDVADPTAPALLSRVDVGDGWTWTEANWDEKAFSVLPDEGLILVPFQSWTESNYIRGVQLIDLLPETLVQRGVIHQDFAPRRATLHRDRILSLSATELLSIDATDRDAPTPTGSLDLAWSVDRLVKHGDYLIQIENGAGTYDGQAKPMLRVARVNSPDAVLFSLPLDGPPIQGHVRKDDILFLAQTDAPYWGYLWLEADAAEGDEEVRPPAHSFVTTALDLSGLPALSLLSQDRIELTETGGGDWRPVWPDERTLVWVGGGGAYPWRGGPIPMAMDAMIWWPWFGGHGSQLLAVQVDPSGAVEHVSSLNLGTNHWWSFSRPFAVDGKVFLSHQGTVFHEDLLIPDMTVTNEVDGDRVVGVWMQQHLLDVVDYRNPREPALRRPVPIPGQLQGLDRAGSILFTTGYHYDPESGITDWTEHLDASAYDGAKVYLIDSMPLENQWPRPVHVAEGGVVYLGKPGYSADGTAAASPVVETWTLPDTGRWTRLGARALSLPAAAFSSLPGLVLVQQQDSSLLLLDASRPDTLPLLGQGRPHGCLWFDLEKADGDATLGVWLPLGLYGTASVPVP